MGTLGDILNATLVLMVVAIALAAGCAPGETANAAALAAAGQRPVVRATNGASASLTLLTCAPNDARASGMGEIIQFLLQQDELVVAQTSGSARLTINTCAGGPMSVAPAPAVRR